VKNGKERLQAEYPRTNSPSMITGCASFHPEKHRVDFKVYLNSWPDAGYEIGLACYLDGHCIDLMSEVAVMPVYIHGTWECAECFETGREYAEDGYIKKTFATRESLLLDHLASPLKAIEYLHSHTLVKVYLGNPNDPGNSSSAVELRDDPKSEDMFLISIGKVELDPCRHKNDPIACWIHRTLASELARVQ